MDNQAQFYQELEDYMALYEKGLKKQAKRLIEQTMVKFDAFDTEIKHNIMLVMCKDFCDDRQYFSALLERGNGEMPFALSKRIRPILIQDCEEYKMPAMRWFYQLYRDRDILQNAYNHTDCDQKTVDLYFNTLIDDLYWGAHHFPEGCLIDEQEYRQIIRDCEAVQKKHQPTQTLIEGFSYYQRLYELWWLYQASDKTKEFSVLCEESGLSFSPEITIYYEK